MGNLPSLTYVLGIVPSGLDGPVLTASRFGRPNADYAAYGPRLSFASIGANPT
jgi:hypothetical protein